MVESARLAIRRNLFDLDYNRHPVELDGTTTTSSA